MPEKHLSTQFDPRLSCGHIIGDLHTELGQGKYGVSNLRLNQAAQFHNPA